MRRAHRAPGPGAPALRRTDARGPRRAPAVRRRGPQDWFAQQLVLVLSGQRPLTALLGHAVDRAYDQLSRLAPHTPLRPRPGTAPAPVLRGVGVCRPGPDAIEAFVRVAAGDRLRAFAVRLERRSGDRWVCTAVELDVVP
jgi:hypothetical protein